MITDLKNGEARSNGHSSAAAGSNAIEVEHIVIN